MIYAQSVAAQEVGFAVTDTEFAADLGGTHGDRALSAMTKIASMHAKTWTGLQAKAGIVPLMMQDSHGSLEERERAFVLSFAAEVKAFLESEFRSSQGA